MHRFCNHNKQKSKRCLAWFNHLCAQCRSHFPIKGVDGSSKEGLGQSNDGLITAEECYNSIKRSVDSSTAIETVKDDIWWKVPLILLILAAILTILMSACFLCQRALRNSQNESAQNMDFDLSKRQLKMQRQRNDCNDDYSRQRPSSSICSCFTRDSEVYRDPREQRGPCNQF